MLSVKLWLHTANGNFKKEEEEKKKNNNRSSSCRPQQSRTTSCNKWLITNLGTASRKEHKYSSFSRSSKMWTRKLFFHPLDLTVLNSWILLSLCGAKYSDRDFRQLLVRKLIEEAEKNQDRPNPRLVVRPSVGARHVLLLKSRHNKHWPAKSWLLAAKERAQCINKPDVMWASVWCFVLCNITPKYICKAPSL